jgi:predicted negative regulator of RcsB-dependent stress response
MNENYLNDQYDINKQSKIKIFYDSNKKIIIITLSLIIFSGLSLSFYSDYKQKNKIEISENYINAKIFLENKNEGEALKILKEVIFSNDRTYSSLSLFMIINENLIKDSLELNILINHILLNNAYDSEIKNLLIYKKALLNAETIKESDLLDALMPILNSESLWKSHALFLLGDYFLSNSDYNKAKEFYAKILTIQNLKNGDYQKARLKLEIISND